MSYQDTDVHMDGCREFNPRSGEDYTGTWSATAECGWVLAGATSYRTADDALTAHCQQAHPKQWALVEPVKAHALERYNDGGWDVVVETYTDPQICEAIGKATTLAGAVRKFAGPVSVWADRQADAINSAF